MSKERKKPLRKWSCKCGRLWIVLAPKLKKLALFDQLEKERAEISAHFAFLTFKFDQKSRSYDVKREKKATMKMIFPVWASLNCSGL